MPTTDEEKIYQIALSIIPQIGVINARRLMSYMGTAKDIFKSTRSQLLKIPHIGPVLSAAIHQSGLVSQAESIWLDCQRERTEILFYTDLNFPNRLKQIFDSPIVLYWKGNQDLNAEKILAVVGTRKATEYGKRVTSDLVKDSIGQGITFVSGLAYGIDIALHKACIDSKINTVAKIQLVNMMGKTVSNESAEVFNGALQKTIHTTSSYASGLYIVKVLIDDKLYKTQLIFRR